MPHPLVLAALGLGAYVGSKLLIRQSKKSTSKKQGANKHAPARNLGKLEQDRETGVYRPSSGVHDSGVHRR